MPPVSAPTVLITGAARRIGCALALDLAAQGWQVALHYRSSAHDAGEVERRIVAQGGRAVALSADLADTGALRALVEATIEQLGPPQCLVNNASEFLHDSIDSLADETWDKHFAVNLKAPVFLAKAVADALPAGVEGNIINIIDQRVWNLKPDFFSYTLSKAGLWTATRTLAQSLAPRLRVNAIGPGPVFRSVHQTEQDFADETRSTLLGKGPAPEEIAAAVRFILATPSMTGQMIALDGGQHLT